MHTSIYRNSTQYYFIEIFCRARFLVGSVRSTSFLLVLSYTYRNIRTYYYVFNAPMLPRFWLLVFCTTAYECKIMRNLVTWPPTRQDTEQSVALVHSMTIIVAEIGCWYSGQANNNNKNNNINWYYHEIYNKPGMNVWTQSYITAVRINIQPYAFIGFYQELLNLFEKDHIAKF